MTRPSLRRGLAAALLLALPMLSGCSTIEESGDPTTIDASDGGGEVDQSSGEVDVVVVAGTESPDLTSIICVEGSAFLYVESWERHSGRSTERFPGGPSTERFPEQDHRCTDL